MKSKTSENTLIVKICGKKSGSTVQPVAEDAVKSEPEEEYEQDSTVHIQSAGPKPDEISEELLARYSAAMADAEQTIIKLEKQSPTKDHDKDPFSSMEENNNVIMPSEKGKTGDSSDRIKTAIKRKITGGIATSQVMIDNAGLINIAPLDEDEDEDTGSSKKLRFEIKDETEESNQSDSEDMDELEGTLGEMEGKGVTCTECGFLSPNKGELHKHMRKHTPDKPYACPVEGCNFRTRYPGNIKHHLPSHKDERPFACDRCDLRFKTKSQLSTHSLVHNTVKPFACEICGFRCKRRWELKMHKLSHSDQRFFKCDVCGHATKTQSDLQKHKAKHTERRDFKCDHCEKAYKDNRALRKHVRYTHAQSEPVNCHLCHKEFRNKINLRNHLRLHDGHYPFKCDVCDMRFANNHNKRVHMEVHQGDRPFRCPVCPYAGKQELDVRAHIGVMHHDDKIYRCGACDIGFSKERGLIQHFNTDKHKRVVEQRSRVVRDASMDALAVKQEVLLPDQGATISLLSNGHVVLSQVKEEPADSDSENDLLCSSAGDSSDATSPEKSSLTASRGDPSLLCVKPGSVHSLHHSNRSSTSTLSAKQTSSKASVAMSTGQAPSSAKPTTGSFLDNLLPAIEAAMKSGSPAKPPVFRNASSAKTLSTSEVAQLHIPANKIPQPIKTPSPISIFPIATASGIQTVNAGAITVLLNQTPAGLMVATQPTLGTIVVQNDPAVISNGPTVPVIDIKPDPDAEENNNNSKDQNSNLIKESATPDPTGEAIVIIPHSEADNS